jgi:hypothetical protein
MHSACTVNSKTSAFDNYESTCISECQTSSEIHTIGFTNKRYGKIKVTVLTETSLLHLQKNLEFTVFHYL